MELVILDAIQADALRGPTVPGKALNPVALTDGRFALSPAVLDDDHGEAANELLAALPVQTIGPGLLPVDED